MPKMHQEFFSTCILPICKQCNVIELPATTVVRLRFNYDLESILPLGFKLPVFYRPPRPPGARPGAGRFAQELLQELWCREAWKQEQQCTSTLDVCENTTMGPAMAIRKRQYVRAINKHVLAIVGRGDTKWPPLHSTPVTSSSYSTKGWQSIVVFHRG